MQSWKKIILIMVIGLMLVAPWGVAGLVRPAVAAAQPSAQLSFAIPDGMICGSGYVQVAFLVTPLVNWNS